MLVDPINKHSHCLMYSELYKSTQNECTLLINILNIVRLCRVDLSLCLSYHERSIIQVPCKFNLLDRYIRVIDLLLNSSMRILFVINYVFFYDDIAIRLRCAFKIIIEIILKMKCEVPVFFSFLKKMTPTFRRRNNLRK